MSAKDVISSLKQSYEERDLAGLMACFAPDDDVLLVGTGADEKRIGRPEIEAQVTRDWHQTEAISMRFRDVAVSAAGNVAWAATDGAFDLKVGGKKNKTCEMDLISGPTRLKCIKKRFRRQKY